MNTAELHRKIFLALLLGVSLAFLAILWPFYGAVFWGAILALLFMPLHRRLLQRMPSRPNLAALSTLALCLLIVILPVALITASLVREAAVLVNRLRSGELNFGLYLQHVIDVLPPWVAEGLDRLGLGNVAAVRAQLASAATQISQFIAGQALTVGQNTAHFVVSLGIMLYLLFFLLRDGQALSMRIRQALPLDEAHKRDLLAKFATVIRATVKGNVVVALTQGALGGLIFWVLGIQGPVLWATLMAFLSLLPAVGAGLIWGPVAIYFLATGAFFKALILIAFGVFVIGLVDNLLRPILVGKDTKLPDYLVLISTLGGMSLFGINGFVIGPLIAALFVASWDLFAARASHTDRADGKD
ncbi:AI-2E family transporter [Caldimonas taiwanensis]|uniref:AI-2E family transporter n=1 Tax=Caldimonas taiwanensis TaxID=307483 RepID=UPI0007846ABB|nr:AI-2E family transporter [Caldimonas taiwanensis]